MEIKIDLFGNLAEAIGEQSISINTPTAIEPVALYQLLIVKYPQLINKPFKIAVNETLDSQDQIQTNDTIALLPAFSGG